MANRTGSIKIVRFYSKRSMESDKQDQAPPGDGDNKPTETSVIISSTQKNTGTKTRRDSSCQINMDTLEQPVMGAVLVTIMENKAKKVQFDIIC